MDFNSCSVCVCVSPQTLYTVTELEESVFSQFPPRHGLTRLYWFLHKIASTNFNLYQLCKDEGTDFGFHYFENREQLLPDDGLIYYTLGNLKEIEAKGKKG